MASIDEIHQLKKIFDDEIYSILKYGFGKRNILVVLKDGFNINYLLKIKPYISKLKKNNNIIVVSKTSIIANNIDILNIRLTYAVIYGKDPFKSIDFETAKIRKQIEYEANKTLINLKNELLARKWSWQVRNLLYSVVPRILPLIVAHLYILGEKIPNAIPDTIHKYLKHNPDVIVLLQIKKDIKKDEAIKLYEKVFVLLEGLAKQA